MKKNRRRLPVRAPDEVSSKRSGRKAGLLEVRSEKAETNIPSPQNLLVSKEIALPGGFLTIGFAVATLGLLWAFWPTVVQLTQTWNREPDYSHGWFVVPITIYLLWAAKETMPKPVSGIHWGGMALLAIVIAVRVFSRWAYFDFVDGWMVPLSVVGLAWTLAGKKWAQWALPGLLFLFFMVPLPFRIENELSRPLQWFATKASCFSLQLLGLPAISEGTTILLGGDRLEVERACSGLRIFMGVFALSYVYAYLVNRVWWERVVLVVAAVPIALVANTVRIVVTGFTYYLFENDTIRHFAHDAIGYAMIAIAAGLFGLTLIYMRWLIPETDPLDTVSLQRV